MKLVTIPSAIKQLTAEGYKVSRSTLARLVKSGTITSLQVGNRALIDIEELRPHLDAFGSMNLREIASETGLTESIIRRGMAEGWIPFRRSRRTYSFDLDLVYEAIRARMNKK